jgi:hypothetical protein
MTETSDRNELERRLKQARRLAREYDEPLTKGRLARLINEIEEQLRQAEDRLKRGAAGLPPIEPPPPTQKRKLTPRHRPNRVANSNKLNGNLVPAITSAAEKQPLLGSTSS